jgi:hypothetical protein
VRRYFLVLENTSGADVAEKINFDLIVFSFRSVVLRGGKKNCSVRGSNSRPLDCLCFEYETNALPTEPTERFRE